MQRLSCRIRFAAVLLVLVFACGASLAQTGPGLGLATDTDGTATGDQWVPCVIHCHSVYSDGADTVDLLADAAKAAGARVLVITDHVEDMGLTTFRHLGDLPFERLSTKRSDYGKYYSECQAASRRTGILVVPGVEVGLGNGWDPWREPGAPAGRKVHLLGIGAMPPAAYSLLMTALEIDLAGKPYGGPAKDLRVGQSMAAGLMHAYGLAVVIAHPWLSGWLPWEKDDLYTFYRGPGQSVDGYSWDGAANVDGVEFFNGSDSGQRSLEALNLVNKDPGGKAPAEYAVTAGSDCHSLALKGGDFASHITWVRLPAGALTGNWEAACGAIAAGIKSGYTTAGVGALQRGDTLDAWLKRVRGRDTAPQPEYWPFQYIPGRLIGRPEQWAAEPAKEPEPDEPTGGGQTITNPKDPTMKLILIPAGEAIFGVSFQGYVVCDGGLRRQFRKSLPAYYIGETEVTNAQYKRFVDATGHRAPAHWDNGRIPPGLENHPVTRVSWEDAKAYCDWAGLRLPSELEWEKAARGTDGRMYPWGDEWDPERCCCLENHGAENTSPVGSYPLGRSPYRLEDMAGNVSEWCADRYDPAAFDVYTMADMPESRVFRGGSWADDARACCPVTADSAVAGVRSNALGFRVARDAVR